MKILTVRVPINDEHPVYKQGNKLLDSPRPSRLGWLRQAGLVGIVSLCVVNPGLARNESEGVPFREVFNARLGSVLTIEDIPVAHQRVYENGALTAPISHPRWDSEFILTTNGGSPYEFPAGYCSATTTPSVQEFIWHERIASPPSLGSKNGMGICVNIYRIRFSGIGEEYIEHKSLPGDWQIPSSDLIQGNINSNCLLCRGGDSKFVDGDIGAFVDSELVSVFSNRLRSGISGTLGFFEGVFQDVALIQGQASDNDGSKRKNAVEDYLKFSVAVLAASLFGLLAYFFLSRGLDQMSTAKIIRHLLLSLGAFVAAACSVCLALVALWG
jgi:hypothetical protein